VPASDMHVQSQSFIKACVESHCSVCKCLTTYDTFMLTHLHETPAVPQSCSVEKDNMWCAGVFADKWSGVHVQIPSSDGFGCWS